MLRALVIALFVANLAWWAWHSPWLNLGLATPSEREPQRLARQVNPEQVRVLPPQPREPERAPSTPASAPEPATPAASSADATAAACLETGPLDEAGFNTARRALEAAGVAPDAWVDMRRERPASQAVYMGRFPDAEQMQRKREELQRIHVPFEVYAASTPAGLAPGLTLGRYPTVEQAEARLKELQAKGVRTARVVQLAAASAEHTVRVDQATPAQQAALAKATAAPASATGWRTCGQPAP